jgi:DNA-binding MarR family transcriptional regulator
MSASNKERQPNSNSILSASQADDCDESPNRALLYDLLGFFYPIHYQIGMELERRICGEKLSRQQAAIIWLIESEVGLQGWMRRKDIENVLSDWFDSRNSHVTQLLRELSSAPLALVKQMTNPESGREKLVALTEAGRKYFDMMIAEGLEYFAELLPHMSDDELRQGMKFLAKAFGPPTLRSATGYKK